MFTDLLLEEDLYDGYRKEVLDIAYLRELEGTLGVPSIWTIINVDRVVRSGQLLRAYPYDKSPYTHEEMLRIVQSCAKRISAFLDKEKPDFIVFSIVGNIASMLLYKMAQQRGIQTLLIDCARIGTGYFLTETYDASTFVWKSWDRVRTAPTADDQTHLAWADAWLREYRKKPSYYLDASASKEMFKKVMDPQAFSFFGRLGASASFNLKDIVAYYRDPHRNDYTRISPWWNMWDKAMRNFRLARGYDDLFEVPVKGEKHAYFALHSEPEAYPMILAPNFTDQLWLAKQIARSLPAGWKLYVKDHPVMLGFRPRAYYEELKKIPNVRLLDSRRSGLEVAAQADLTLAITGTACWEAALLGKPSIIFGNMFYRPLSAVRLCERIQDLPQLIQEHVEGFKDNPAELTSFLAALRAENVDVDLVHIWDVKGGMDTEQNRVLLAPLAAKIAEAVKHRVV